MTFILYYSYKMIVFRNIFLLKQKQSLEEIKNERFVCKTHQVFLLFSFIERLNYDIFSRIYFSLYMILIHLVIEKREREREKETRIKNQ